MHYWTERAVETALIVCYVHYSLCIGVCVWVCVDGKVLAAHISASDNSEQFFVSTVE